MRKHLCSIAVLLATMALLCGCGEKPVRSTASAPDSNGVADPKKGFFAIVASRADREGPMDAATVSPAARRRWREASPPYRPKTLARVAAALDRD